MLMTGDCLDMLPLLDADSIDACVTDPPYGLAFMGKKWDHDVPSVEIWREVYRVLKPGAHLLAFFGTRTYHRGVCAIEDAGFEIRDQVQWLYGCLDDQTDCLTTAGWKRYDEVTTADTVLQWDHATGELSWTRPSEVLVYPFDGDLVHLANRHIDQALTPNHRVYAKVRRHARRLKPDAFEVLEAREIAGRSSAWQVDLPLAGELLSGDEYDPDFAYLVGWWLTDAWAHGDGKAAMFSQCKPETLAQLRAALAPYAPSEYVKTAKAPRHRDEHTFYLTGPVADRLLAEFPTRELDWRVLGWSFASRRRLFEGLMAGDGSRKVDQHAAVFWSQAQSRRDVFVALALSLGFRAFEDREKGCVHVNQKTSTSQLQAKHLPRKIRYRGDVWCLRVATGAFVVRRNGRPFITGNSGFPKSHDVSKAIDKMAGAEREVVRERYTVKRINPGATVVANGEWGKQDVSYTATDSLPATDAAAQWQGWGTALKPAHEPIVVARKPLIGTVAENVLAHGTGGINVDGCRVGDEVRFNAPAGNKDGGNSLNMSAVGMPQDAEGRTVEGRWPANIVHDGSDEVLAAFPDAPGQLRAVGPQHGAKSQVNVYGDYGPRDQFEPRLDIDKSAARFFYAAKANKKDRDDGLDRFIELPSAASEFRPNHTEKAAAGEDGNPYGRWKPIKNNHPTVKPTDLMRWLCRLVTPAGGIVLDPFMGSGSTGRAAALEGFEFVGIEMDPQYVAIAEARIAAAVRQKEAELYA